MHRRLVKKYVVFLVKVLYQIRQHANGSLTFVLEILMSNMSSALVGQVPKESNEILAKIEQVRHIRSHDIAYELNFHHRTVLKHLQKVGFKKKLDVWVPHESSVKNKMDRLNICDTLLKRNKIELFLKRIITGDEKWVNYENIVRNRSWRKRDERSQTTSKLGLTANKVMR